MFIVFIILLQYRLEGIYRVEYQAESTTCGLPARATALWDVKVDRTSTRENVVKIKETSVEDDVVFSSEYTGFFGCRGGICQARLKCLYFSDPTFQPSRVKRETELEIYFYPEHITGIFTRLFELRYDRKKAECRIIGRIEGRKVD